MIPPPDRGANKATPLVPLDRIANQLIAQGQTVRFVIAQSSEKLKRVYRLRYDEVVGHGWASPADYPDQMEVDAYDERASQIVGWNGEALVASTRLIFPSVGRRLPTEAAFDLIVEPRGKVVDMGRTIAGLRLARNT